MTPTEEVRLTILETRLDTVLPTLATKADLERGISEVIKWVAGIGFGVTTTIIAVMAFMLNRL